MAVQLLTRIAPHAGAPALRIGLATGRVLAREGDVVKFRVGKSCTELAVSAQVGESDRERDRLCTGLGDHETLFGRCREMSTVEIALQLIEDGECVFGERRGFGSRPARIGIVRECGDHVLL